MSSYVCPECGLDYDTVSPSDAKVAIRSYPRRYRAALAAVIEDEADDGLLRRRPELATWSALEYTAHVADLLDLFAKELRRMFVEDHPDLREAFWDPDERQRSQQYNEKEPGAVLDQLADAADRLAGVLDRVDADSWRRTAVFPWGERDLLTMARNAVHEGTHHLRDIERVLDAVRARP